MALLRQNSVACSVDDRAMLLRELLLCLPDDSRWRQVRYVRAAEAAKLQAMTRSYWDALRALATTIEHMAPPRAAGLDGFLHAAAGLQHTWPNLRPSDHPSAMDSIDNCMHWQCAAYGVMAGLLVKGTPTDFQALWHQFALGAPGLHSEENTARFWMLAIVGKPHQRCHNGRLVDPGRFDGPALHALRRGETVDSVCTTFHLHQARLAGWLQDNAARIIQPCMAPLDPLPWWRQF